MNTDNFAMQQIIPQQLFTRTSFKLIRFQPGFNPRPEVGYVNQFTVQIRAFTQIQFSLICILNRFKRAV